MDRKEHYPLKSLHTFHTDAVARYYSGFSSPDGLEVLRQSEVPLLVLGGGSNLLFTKDFDGWILHNEIKGISLVHEDDDHVFLRIGAGENWHQLVLYTLDKGWCGLENLALIPGSVGASPIQNIGAYGVELQDVFWDLEAYMIHEGTISTFSLNDCAFGYRDSVFKNKLKGQCIILTVGLRLSKKPLFHASYGALQAELDKMGVVTPTQRIIAQAVMNIRQRKLPDPDHIGNAGSFFKNPVVSSTQLEKLKIKYPDIVSFPQPDGRVKLAAGWLVEQCGWKGYRNGDAGCHEQQALVLVNYGNASGADIYDLSEQIRRSVWDAFEVQLEREVNVY